jgi:3-oxoacyl-[acyl-carrier protein] reductase
MDLGIEGKTAIVTASTDGLGFASALALAKEGCRVVINGRNEEKGRAAAKGHENLFFVKGDITDPATCESLLQSALAQFGEPTILVGNTGGPPPSRALDTEPDRYLDATRTLLLPLVEMSRLVLPYMKARRWGRLVFITSGVVREPADSLVLSNSIRMAVHGYAKSLAREVAAEGITVNCVMPGRIATARLRSLDEAAAKRTGRSTEEIIEENLKAIPARRYGSPEELGALVCFLCSEKASYISGTAIPVDGAASRSHF